MMLGPKLFLTCCGMVPRVFAVSSWIKIDYYQNSGQWGRGNAFLFSLNAGARVCILPLLISH